jgi:hypothetical protein
MTAILPGITIHMAICSNDAQRKWQNIKKWHKGREQRLAVVVIVL